MGKLRDHDSITIEEFNGLFRRGHRDNTPLDHFQDCDNVRFTPGGDVETRYGVGISQNVLAPLENIARIYNYPTQIGNTLIILTYDAATNTGNVYHFVDATTIYGPILTIVGMADIAFVPYAGRGYISPFNSLGPKTNPPLTAVSLAAVFGVAIDAGVHKYAVSFVTASGETTPGPLASVTTDPAGLANPVLAPIISLPFGGGNNMVNGGTYSWKFTYSLTLGGPETLVGPISNILINDNTKFAGIPTGGVIPIPAAALIVNVYRTTNGGALYFRELSTNRLNFINNPGAFFGVGTMTDATLVTQPSPPLVNLTATGEVDITAIPANFPGVLSRNIYRTEANLNQLKLLANIPDNTTVNFHDAIADAGLGVNAPVDNTASLAGVNVEKGLENEFLYVYAGDGTAARKAAGAAPTGALLIANGIAGFTDPGFHLFGVVNETLSGALSAPGALTGFTTIAAQSVSFGNVPTSGSPFVIRRHIVATKVIPSYTGNTTGYQYFFIPGGTIDNNTDTFLNNVSFFDADLLDDASHLFDNFAEIPAGAVLTIYHDRLVLATTFNDISVAYISAIGEPEAINQIDGLIVINPDGNPITNAQELRDVLYIFKRNKTWAYTDNGLEPANWPQILIDNSLGTFVHGIATVIDSGSAGVDFLIICTYQGVSLFNGRFATPELSWKIESFWKELNRPDFRKIQVLNASIQKEIYIVLPDGNMLVGNYAVGMDPKNIRWAPISFQFIVNTVAIWDIDTIIIGADVS